MEKTIKLDENTEITLSNNISFIFNYHATFDKDVFETVVPVLKAIPEIIDSLPRTLDGLNGVEVLQEIGPENIAAALSELSTFELLDVVEVTWSMARAADDKIPPFYEWMQSLGSFPLDIILPEVYALCSQCFISTKN